MAKEIEKALASLREEQNESEQYGLNNGSIEEFFDFLEPEDRDSFEEIKSTAENKKKWLKIFDKMLTQIAARDFADALETFESLREEICL